MQMRMMDRYRILIRKGKLVTIALLAISLLLLFEGQTRDILWNIGETMQLATRGQMADGFRWAGVEYYAEFWASSLLLAIVFGGALPITCSLRLGGEKTFLDSLFCWYAARDCSRWISIITLFTIHFAFLSAIAADYWRGFILVGIGTVGVAIPHCLTRNARSSVYFAVYLILVLVVALFAYWAAFKSGDEGMYAGIVSSMTPATAWLLSRRLPPPQRPLTGPLLFGLTVLTCFTFFVLSIKLPLAIGTAPFAFLWLASFVLAITCGLMLLDRLRSRLPKWSSVVFVTLLIAFIVFAREKAGLEHLDNPVPYPALVAGEQSNNTALSDASIIPKIAIHADGGGLRAAVFTAQVLAIADDLTCGAFGEHVVAASGVSGGSLGIATWVVMREEWKQASPVPTDGSSWETCKEEQKKYPKGSLMMGGRPLWRLVNATLLQDHLSMAFATMLTSDFVTPRGIAQRGQALLDSWQGTALNILWQVLGPGERRAYAADLRRITAGLPRAPLLLFTSTDVDTGGRVVFTNANWEPHARQGSIAIGEAAFHSARFPVISPAGSVFFDKAWRRVADGGYFDNSGADSLRALLVEARDKQQLNDKVIVARVNGNPVDSASDHRCGDFGEQLRKQGWTFSGLLVQYSASGASTETATSRPPDHGGWSPLDTYWATRNAHAEDAVQALSTAGLPHIVEKVIAPLQLDYFGGFVGTCSIPKYDDVKDESDKVKGKSDDVKGKSFTDLPPCAQRNLQICAIASHLRRAPLGWTLSRGSADPLDLSAYNAAVSLITAVGLTTPNTAQ